MKIPFYKIDFLSFTVDKLRLKLWYRMRIHEITYSWMKAYDFRWHHIILFDIYWYYFYIIFWKTIFFILILFFFYSRQGCQHFSTIKCTKKVYPLLFINDGNFVHLVSKKIILKICSPSGVHFLYIFGRFTHKIPWNKPK